jgi:hypothetical protein
MVNSSTVNNENKKIKKNKKIWRFNSMRNNPFQKNDSNAQQKQIGLELMGFYAWTFLPSAFRKETGLAIIVAASPLALSSKSHTPTWPACATKQRSLAGLGPVLTQVDNAWTLWHQLARAEFLFCLFLFFKLLIIIFLF